MADLSGIARLVRISVPGCPEPLIHDAIIASCIEFCRQTRVVTEDLILETVAAQAVYPLATEAGTRAWRVELVERDGKPLNPSTRHLFKVNSNLRKAGQASDYYLADSSLVLGPVPESIESLDVSVAIEPVIGATAIPDILYDEWRRVIAAGAKAILLAAPKTEWQSLVDAANEQAAFDQGVTDAITKRDSGGTGTVPRASPSWC